MKLLIEIDLQPNIEYLLIDKINEYCQDWFGKKPVLKQYDVSLSLPLDEVFAAIQEVKDAYPTSVFPEAGTSMDAKAAKMARITCDNIMHRVQMRYDAGGNDR